MSVKASPVDQRTGIGYFARSAARSTQAVADLIDHHDSNATLSTLSLEDADLLLDEVQNIVMQAGNVARLLWPAEAALQRGAEALRTAYRFSDDSALRQQDLQGAIGRFESSLRDGRAGAAVEPPSLQYVGIEDDAPRARAPLCRAYFVDIGVLELPGVRYDVEPLIRELWRIAWVDHGEAAPPSAGAPP